MPSLVGFPTCALLSAFALVACEPRAPASPGGRPGSPEAGGAWISRSSPPGGVPVDASTVAPEPAPPSPWEHAPRMASFAPAGPRGRSQHFTGELEAEVLMNAAAAGYPTLGPSRRLAAGAVLVEVHYPLGGSEPSAWLAMVKHPPGYDPEGGDWEYVVLTPTGDATQRGRVPLCRRCHAEAPHDHLFGGPR